MFHRESIHHIYKEIIARVSVPSIELVILKSVANDNVLRIETVNLAP